MHTFTSLLVNITHLICKSWTYIPLVWITWMLYGNSIKLLNRWPNPNHLDFVAMKFTTFESSRFSMWLLDGCTKQLTNLYGYNIYLNIMYVIKCNFPLTFVPISGIFMNTISLDGNYWKSNVNIRKIAYENEM